MRLKSPPTNHGPAQRARTSLSSWRNRSLSSSLWGPYTLVNHQFLPSCSAT
uniref:Uncharacterized protein n=1 Tax=Arundo donax TaxID=35708 RepID=A0A0A8Z8E2_ARUDO